MTPPVRFPWFEKYSSVNSSSTGFTLTLQRTDFIYFNSDLTVKNIMSHGARSVN